MKDFIINSEEFQTIVEDTLTEFELFSHTSHRVNLRDEHHQEDEDLDDDGETIAYTPSSTASQRALNCTLAQHDTTALHHINSIIHKLQTAHN